MSEDKLLDKLWVEKYRPKTIDDIVLPDSQKREIATCLDSEEIPNLFFCGPAGGGKTTLARIIIDKLVKSDSDILMFNGSEITGVDYIRNDVIGFLRSPPFKSKLKIVFIDEFDYMSNNAQASLRAIIEKYSSNGRFIVTGNYKHKIIDPLLSRLTTYEMDSLDLGYIQKYIKNILTTENVEYDDDTVNLLVENCYPDVRKTLNIVQKNVVDSKLQKIDTKKLISNEQKIIGLIVQICDDIHSNNSKATIDKNGPEILKILNNKETVDYIKIYEILSSNDKIPLWAKIKINQYTNTHNECVLESAHFMSMIYEILIAGLRFKKEFG